MVHFPILPQNAFKNYLSVSPFILLRKVSILRFLFFREYFCPASERFVRSSNDLLSLPSDCLVFSGNYSGVSFASPRTVFSVALGFSEKIRPFSSNDIFHLLRLFHFLGTIFPRAIFIYENVVAGSTRAPLNSIPEGISHTKGGWAGFKEISMDLLGVFVAD